MSFLRCGSLTVVVCLCALVATVEAQSAAHVHEIAALNLAVEGHHLNP